MEKNETRTEPPSMQANNQDVFLWALYLLGGGDRDIDVEDIFLKSFELAPQRLSWRTRIDIPDYKKTSKALQSIEAKSHVGLIHHTGRYHRRLTAAGTKWVETYRQVFESIYADPKKVSASLTNDQARKAKRAMEHDQFKNWKSSAAFDRFDLAELFECSGASPDSIWQKRIDEYLRVAEVTANPVIIDFLADVSRFIFQNGGKHE